MEESDDKICEKYRRVKRKKMGDKWKRKTKCSVKMKRKERNGKEVNERMQARE